MRSARPPFTVSRRTVLKAAAAGTVVGTMPVTAARADMTQAAAPGTRYQGPPRDPQTGMPIYGPWTNSLIGAGGFVTGIHTTPADPNVLYLRNDASGTYRSDNRGKFWYLIDDGTSARGASVDPRNADVLTLIKQDGIYHCARVTANFRNPELTVTDIWSHLVDQPDFAQTNGTYRGRGDVIARDPDDPDLLLAGTLSADAEQPCLFRSTDGGASWENVQGSPAGIQTTDLRFDPHHTGAVYVASQPSDRSGDASYEPGLWKSPDRGEHWVKQTNDAPIEFRFDPHVPEVLYGYFDPEDGNGTGATVRRSTDSGRTWSPIMGGLPSNARFQTIECHRGRILLLTGTQDYGATIWRLNADGTTWAVYNDGAQDTVEDSAWWATRRPTIDDVSAVAFNQADPDEWYLTSAYATYASSDAGRHWTYSSMGLEEMVTMSIAQDPSPGSATAHTAIADWMYFRLEDDGERYDIHRYPDIHILNRISVTAAEPTRIYATSANYNSDPAVGRICISDDGGDTWTSIDAKRAGLPYVTLNDSLSWYELSYGPDPDQPNPVSPAIMGLSAHPRLAGHVAAAIGGTYEQYTNTSYGGFPLGAGTGAVGVFRSFDGGASWQPVPGTLTGSVPAQTFSYYDPLALSGDGSIVLAPWYGGPLQCWDPQTEDWFIPDVDFSADAYQVAGDPNNDGRFILAVNSGVGGTYETWDGGHTWKQLLTQRTNAVAYDVHDPSRIAVALQDEPYVLYSDNYGRRFERFDQLSHQEVNMAFVADRLLVGAGTSSYYFTDLPRLVNVRVHGPVNPHAGLVSVTVSATGTFNPAQSLDIHSLRFGAEDYVTAERGARVARARRRRNGDLLLHFSVAGTHLGAGRTLARLVGRTHDGRPILGTDRISVRERG